MKTYKVENVRSGAIYTITDAGGEYVAVGWEDRSTGPGSTRYARSTVESILERGLWKLVKDKETTIGEIGNPKVGAASKKYSLRYMPLSANIEANRALENGAEKYGLCNWRDTNVKASVYIDAALRHIAQWQEGQENASDSTVHNLGHAMASLAIIIDAQAQEVLIDDRPTKSQDTDALLLRA
jgi:hypothetical protein